MALGLKFRWYVVCGDQPGFPCILAVLSRSGPLCIHPLFNHHSHSTHGSRGSISKDGQGALGDVQHIRCVDSTRYLIRGCSCGSLSKQVLIVFWCPITRPSAAQKPAGVRRQCLHPPKQGRSEPGPETQGLGCL